MFVPVSGGALRRRLRLLGLACAVLFLGACNPTFNWRELRPEGSPLLALMPCKPESASRPVPMDGGAPRDLHVHSCDAGGLTFAVAWVDVGEAARVPGALAGWRRATLAAVQVDPVRADDPAINWTGTVAGATPVAGLAVQGRDHRGTPVKMRAVHFTQGTQVFQAAVYGPAIGDEVWAPFFEGLKLR